MAEKAKIKVLEGPNAGEIEVMYNPREYSVSTMIEASGEGENLQFKRATMPEFTVPLFFDTYEEQTDVREKTEKITMLQLPVVEGRKTKSPPKCLFVWGGFTYQGLISKVEQKFTMFLSTGIPVRAELTVTFRDAYTKEEYKRLRGKEACRKIWTVKSGDRLDLIAYKALKDSARWRKIADVNNITNPPIFPADKDIGRRLIIPD
jgi:hypothetical protein